MKFEKFQQRGNNSVCGGAFQILRGRAPAQLRGNIDGSTKWFVSVLQCNVKPLLRFHETTQLFYIVDS
jgi:hypothetical protein